MAQVTRESPYTVPGDGPDGTDPSMLAGLPAYSVPDSLSSGRDSRNGWDNSGYSPQIGEDGIPDPSRLKRAPLHETRPGEGEPVAWWKRYTRDFLGRHSVEYQDADGFEVAPKTKPSHYERPRPSDVGENRPTMRMSPNTYVFTRPFPGLGTSGHLNGMHFSMADHRREYPIYGMEPARKIRRNTYRLEPEPWDTDLVDMPGAVDSSPEVQVVAAAVAPSGNRAWRL